MSKKRIFIGMTEISAYYGQLTKGLRDKGYSVTFVGGNANDFAYEQSQEDHHWLIVLFERAMAARGRTSRKLFFRKAFYVLISSVLQIPIFLWAFFKHDVFIFGFGLSLLPGNIDLPLLRLCKKRNICNLAHGSESRPPFINGALVSQEGEVPVSRNLASRARAMKNKCTFIEKYADIVICNHFTCHYLSKPFIDRLSCLGRPYALTERVTVNPRNDGKVRILHAPSHVIGKGTLIFRKAISALKQRGYLIDFVEVIGQPNAVVLNELALCDFVVDTLYSDIPMAGFATEAACFGKPAVVGGYGWDILKKLIPKDMFPPSQLCHPDMIEDAIEQLVINEVYRKELGEKARRFVEERWSPQAVAERFIWLINETVPEEWFSSPTQYCYLHGWGYSEQTVKAIIRGLIKNNGIKSLQLSNKPRFEQEFKTFAYSNHPM